MNDTNIVEFVRSFMFNSKRYREPHLELSVRSREYYESWSEQQQSPLKRANLKLPFGYSVIESLIPQIVEIFLGDETILTFEGKTREDAQYEQLITDFHNKQLRDMKFTAKFSSFIRSMLLDGTAIAKVPYRYKEKKIVKRVNIPTIENPKNIQKIEVLDVSYDAPDFELIPFYDFFPDWTCTMAGSIENMRGLVHRTYTTFSRLKAQKEVYKNLDILKISLDSKGANAWVTPYYSSGTEESRYLSANDNTTLMSKRAGEIEIWEYWGLYDIDEDGEPEECILTIANGDVVIRAQENFYDYKLRPFVACPNIIRDNEFYGIPELVAIIPLIKEAIALRNARLDAVNLSLNPTLLIDKHAGINLKNFYAKAGAVLPVNDINGIRVLNIPDPSIGSLTEYSTLQQEIQTATALPQSTALMTQLGKAYARSATGVSFLNSMLGSRIGIKARNLSEFLFKALGEILLKTNVQFLTDDVWLRFNDAEDENPFKLLPATAFSSVYRIDVKSDLETGGADAQFSRMQQVLQLMQILENTQPGTVRADILLEELLRPVLGSKYKKLTRSPEERAQLQAQNLITQQAAQQVQGANALQPQDVLNQAGGFPSGQEV